MYNDLFENLNRYGYGPIDERIKDVLQKTWQTIALNYVCEYLNRRRPYESIGGSDICRVEVRADEVRAAVYANIQLMEREYPDVVSEWFDLDVSKQDMLLKETFPSTEVYGV